MPGSLRAPPIHAAEAFIVESTGEIAKTHSGVRAEFARLAKEAPEIDQSFPRFLARAYLYKKISDYAVGAGADVTMADANDAIANAIQICGPHRGATDPTAVTVSGRL